MITGIASFNAFQRVADAAKVSKPFTPDVRDSDRGQEGKGNEELANAMSTREGTMGDARQQQERKDGRWNQVRQTFGKAHLLPLCTPPNAAQKIALN